ncbi:MAG: iron ABC transporter permease [Candidatus Omnitrophica bacterium]|nr:iron ABC transporter permease [Candidatus Omnitrophota bacterium]
MEKTWLKNKKNRLLLILVMCLVLAIVMIASAFFGAVSVSVGDILGNINRNIFNLRFQRIMLAVLVGGGLSVAGLVFQSILRNPLADPYVLGVSSGGGLGVVIMMILGIGLLLEVIGIGTVFLFSRELDILSLGEEEARALGVETERIKKFLLLVASLITAAAVSFCGIIGFVGLIVPHTMRLLLNNEHRLLIPACFLGGAIFLVVSDTLARKLIMPVEIPIGVITALIGGPMFIYLLQRKKKILFK